LPSSGSKMAGEIDFVHDQPVTGQRFCALSILDDVTKACLAAISDTPICSRRVVRELAALTTRRGKPALIVSDYGIKFTSDAMQTWASEGDIAWCFNHHGQANTKRHPRGVQRPDARRASGRAAVLRPRPCPRGHRLLRRRLEAPGRFTPPLSPRRAISCATFTGSANRLLLSWCTRATIIARLWLHLDEYQGLEPPASVTWMPHHYILGPNTWSAEVRNYATSIHFRSDSYL
jgi:hypothetical protein